MEWKARIVHARPLRLHSVAQIPSIILSVCYTYADHQTTSVRCLWTSTDRSACHFRNLYYDTHTARFAFFSQSSELRTQPWQPPRYMAGNITNPVSQEEVELVQVQPVEAEKREDGCDPRCTTRPGPRAYVALANKLSSHSPLHFWESRAKLNNTKLCCLWEHISLGRPIDAIHCFSMEGDGVPKKVSPL